MKKIIAILSIGLLISFSLFADVQTIGIHSENTMTIQNGSSVSKLFVDRWQVSLTDKTVYYDTPSQNQVIIDETWQNQYGLQWHQVYQMSENDYFDTSNQKSMELYQHLQTHYK